VGDIRHCFADLSLACDLLGYRPQVELEEGISGLAAWLDGQRVTDQIEHPREELVQRGLSSDGPNTQQSTGYSYRAARCYPYMPRRLAL
jgi:hypothetical protein